MERPKSSLQDHMRGYNLPPDSLFEIQAVYMKRFQNPFSDGLSDEARKAMSQVLEDINATKDTNDTKSANDKVPQTTNGKVPQTRKHAQTKHAEKQERRHKHSKTHRPSSRTFSETFEMKSAERLEGDITDKDFDASKQTKKAIGGKLENAMETIEIVKHGEPDIPVDGDAKKRTSVEKCLVWMEINEGPHT